MTRSSRFTLFSLNDNTSRPFHQAGCLITAIANAQKWTFQFSYQKSLGSIYLSIADSIDSIELSALYQFHTYKTKKERKMHRQQKGK